MGFFHAGGRSEERAMEEERNGMWWGWGGTEVPRCDMGAREGGNSEISGTPARTRKQAWRGEGIYKNVSNAAARTRMREMEGCGRDD